MDLLQTSSNLRRKATSNRPYRQKLKNLGDAAYVGRIRVSLVRKKKNIIPSIESRQLSAIDLYLLMDTIKKSTIHGFSGYIPFCMDPQGRFFEFFGGCGW